MVNGAIGVNSTFVLSPVVEELREELALAPIQYLRKMVRIVLEKI